MIDIILELLPKVTNDKLIYKIAKGKHKLPTNWNELKKYAKKQVR